MPTSLLTGALIVTTFATALSLLLVLRLSARLRALEAMLTPPVERFLPPGRTVPALRGVAASDGRELDLPGLGQPTVIVFLAAGCPKCRGKIPELARMLPAADREGVALWIIADEVSPKGLMAWLEGTPLLDRLLVLERPEQQKLNPIRASPAYLFIDHQQTVQASGFVGDEDWMSFVGQLAEIDTKL